jgi:hypothetical protein
VNALPPEILERLRGYHLPEPVSWWPPAPGWWALAFLVLALLVAAVHWMASRHRRRAAARAARAELDALCAAYGRDGDAGAFARALSRLLRRFALARFPRRRVAGLSGEEWLAFLDAHGGGGRFREGAGRVLAQAPYRPLSDPGRDLPVDELSALARDWIRRNAEGPS